MLRSFGLQGWRKSCLWGKGLDEVWTKLLKIVLLWRERKRKGEGVEQLEHVRTQHFLLVFVYNTMLNVTIISMYMNFTMFAAHVTLGAIKEYKKFVFVNL